MTLGNKQARKIVKDEIEKLKSLHTGKYINSLISIDSGDYVIQYNGTMVRCFITGVAKVSRQEITRQISNSKNIEIEITQVA